jgi:hypothetical protein
VFSITGSLAVRKSRWRAFIDCSGVPRAPAVRTNVDI